ncbi:MAG: hypothetical protein H8E15_00725 [Planctomycetes bacterium]|nr:hypothetical protein [Planctomycetota bacterium]
MKFWAGVSIWLLAASLNAQEQEPGKDQGESDSGQQSDQSAEPFRQEFAPIIPM